MPRTAASHVAHSAVHRAVKAGTLAKPAECEQCGAEVKLEAAHGDYAKPLDVRWLCIPCHRAWDAEKPKGGTPATLERKEAMKGVRDRIKEFRRVPASSLTPNPRNWRTHPQSQQEAMRGILEEVGYVDALMVRELPGGQLEIVDGHLRAETTPDSEVPVLIVDLTDEEAAKVLATFDPLAAMAETNAAKLDELLRDFQTGSEPLTLMLADLAKEAGIIPGEQRAAPDDFPVVDENIPIEHQCPKCGYRFSGGSTVREAVEQ